MGNISSSINRIETDLIICGDFKLDIIKKNENSNDACTLYYDINTLAIVPTICKLTRLKTHHAPLLVIYSLPIYIIYIQEYCLLRSVINGLFLLFTKVTFRMIGLPQRKNILN